MMAAYILLTFGTVFLVLGLARLARDKLKLRPQSRTWLIVAAIFLAIASWLLIESSGGTEIVSSKATSVQLN